MRKQSDGRGDTFSILLGHINGATSSFTKQEGLMFDKGLIFDKCLMFDKVLMFVSKC